MSSVDIIKNFNSIIESFLLQTSPLVGTTYVTFFKTIIKTNALLPIECGIKYTLPYKDFVLNKDERYLADETNYESAINNNTAFNPEQVMSEIFRVKDIYYKLDADSKENVWAILQALVQLMIEYCEIKGIVH